MVEDHDPGFYAYQRLVPATLLRRYKRFLVDVRLDDGAEVTVHTCNTGAMLGCSDPGSRVYLSPATTPGRKLPFTLEVVDAGDSLVGVNTLLPNRLMYQATSGGLPPDLAGYGSVRREVKVGEHSRIDLLLEQTGRRPCYVEIKNVTLAREGTACFPDAVTTRGQKHLHELSLLARQGHRAVILFAVQRNDCHQLAPADDIDPRYGQALRKVTKGGVEAMAFHLEVSVKGVRVGRRLNVELSRSRNGERGNRIRNREQRI